MDQQRHLQLKAIEAYAGAKLGADKTGHDTAHIRRVVCMAERIAHEENVDAFLPTAIAYLHDVVDDKLVDDVSEAREELRDFLENLGLEAGQTDEILHAISNMSFAATLDAERPRLTRAGQIAQDADWLDAIGAIGIARAFYYGGCQRECIYDPAVPPRKHLDRAAYRNLADETIINHFHEKLLKIRGMLNTEAARRIAEERQRFMLEFLDEFTAEWTGDR